MPGLIIKDANSLYEPSKRDKGWFKVCGWLVRT